MPFNKVTGAIALIAALQPLMFTLPARADTVFIETPAIISEPMIEIAPQAIIRTPSTTVIKEESIVLPQTVSPPVYVTPSSQVVKEETTTTTVKKTALPSSEVVSSEVDITLGPKPAFQKRLNLMKEQVNLGLSRGWLTSGQASSFHSRLDSLLVYADAVDLAVTARNMPDSIEAQANTLNIEITNAMKSELGSGPLPQ